MLDQAATFRRAADTMGRHPGLARKRHRL
jgi:hypothetical protein